MDSFEAVKVVHERILKFEPENIARKILGYVYLQDYPDQEMIRLALGPDNILQNLIEKAKIALNLVPILPPIQYTRFPNVPPRFTNWVHPVDPFFNGSTHEEEMVKTCHYFNKGFCKHGNNCRYSHIQAFPHEEQVFANGSLELLEMEITELLKSRGGAPISIATLPMLYYESFGKTLQAEGYLTESQRHGKAGYSLTKLLACLRNSIRLIDRPHGQHAVILAEDTLKYMGPQTERYDPDTIFSSLHQIYLTFPSESAFSEEDVSNYFSTFGPVQDVRIPCQQRRMFGFVTFLSSETVKIILSKGNPHYICGARVLVKPYREKSKLVERKYNENNESSLHMVTTAELQARSIREQLLEAHRKALEREMMRFSNLKIGPRAHQSYLNNFNDEPKVSEDHHITFPSAEQFNYLLNVLNSVPLTDDQESNQGAELPDNPFASVVANSISAII